jgi:hypothetical protein
MSIRKLFSTIFGIAVLAIPVALANAQVTEQAAREQASNVVRSELHSRLSFKSDQFLSIHRDEELEESLAMVTVGWRSGPVFIYKMSPTGVEVKENGIVNHVATDADLMHIVAVSSADGSAYRIRGFGLAESLAEFERLMTALKVRVSSPDQAESLAEFYRKVNPENYEAITPITRLMNSSKRQSGNVRVVRVRSMPIRRRLPRGGNMRNRCTREFRSNRPLLLSAVVTS